MEGREKHGYGSPHFGLPTALLRMDFLKVKKPSREGKRLKKPY